MGQLAPWQLVFDQALHDFPSVVPEVMLIVFGLAILLTDKLLEARQKSWHAATALFGIGFSGLAIGLMSGAKGGTFDNSIVIGPFFVFFGFISLALAAFVIVLIARLAETATGLQLALVLFSTAGMLFVACGNDLIVLFLALEIVAISLYVSSGFLCNDDRPNEAALKLVVTGALASAVLAYGFSLLYGLGGSTDLEVIAGRISAHYSRWPADALAYLAFGTIATGVFFKLAAAPFHQWAPDALEGMPVSVGLFVSAASTITSLALLLRFLQIIFWSMTAGWTPTIAAVALLSLAFGTLAAITQTDVKRLLAYGSIAQAGYLLLCVIAAVNVDGGFNPRGLCAAGYYLLVDVLFTSGAFGVLALLGRKGIAASEISDLHGLTRRSPMGAAFMAISLLSLAGVPLTGGFFAKLMTISVLVETQHFTLAILAALFTLPAAYCYFRVIVAMWIHEPAKTASPEVSGTEMLALGAVAALTIAAGIFPEPFIRFAQSSILLPFVR